VNRDQLIHHALWAAAAFNVGGAFLFGFPASALGELSGLPADVPVAYRALMALFVLLFGGAYAWLATQQSINRPFLAFGAIGKAGAFSVVFILWLASEATGRSVLVISGDLFFAAVFTWWLVGAQPSVPEEARARPLT
jgi:hypothetical protein